MLEISLEFCPDVGYKWDRFSKILPEKGFKFALSVGNGTGMFKLSFVLLLAKLDFNTKKQGRKRNAFKTRGISHVKMIFALSAKLIALYMWDYIVQVRVTGLESSIPEGKICLAMFLVSNKQF